MVKLETGKNDVSTVITLVDILGKMVVMIVG